MRSTLFLFFLIAAASFASCSGDDQNADHSFNYDATTNPVKSVIDSGPSKTMPLLPANNIPGAAVVNAAASTPATGEVNPAHGLPGHRCDIAVGAPLNSTPTLAANNTVPATTTAAPVMNATPVNTLEKPIAQKTAAGMNPAHGQPGHRCDIGVGAPLNSKPAPTTTAATTTITPAAASTSPAVSPVVEKVAAGMNPAHGQPGHRCEIAVGAPLNSKPAAASTPVVVPAETKKDSSKS
jgi:hypothetical protein